MTLTLHFTAEQMARLQAEADRIGVPLGAYAQQRLLGDASRVGADEAARLDAIDAAMGALSGGDISSDDFLHEKHAEIAREEAHWRKHARSRLA